MAQGRNRVTVVIPAWGDYVRYLGAAVASVDANARVVVVDNANPRPLTAPDGGTVVRSDAELSIGAARNLALPHVTTEYVVFLDADDELVPGALDRLVAGLDALPDAVALVGRIVEPSGAPFRAPRPLAASLARRSGAFAWLNSIWPLVPTQGCTIMRTDAVRDAGGYGDASQGEDWELAACLGFRGAIAFDPEPALVDRVRSDAPRAPRETLLESAARVRARLSGDSRFRSPHALPTLAAAQMFAVAAAQPLAALLRPLRGRSSGPAAEPARVSATATARRASA